MTCVCTRRCSTDRPGRRQGLQAAQGHRVHQGLGQGHARQGAEGRRRDDHEPERSGQEQERRPRGRSAGQGRRGAADAAGHGQGPRAGRAHQAHVRAWTGGRADPAIDRRRRAQGPETTVRRIAAKPHLIRQTGRGQAAGREDGGGGQATGMIVLSILNIHGGLAGTHATDQSAVLRALVGRGLSERGS